IAKRRRRGGRILTLRLPLFPPPHRDQGWLDSLDQPGYFASMRAVALKTLESQVNELVHLAEKGETVLITEQDRVIAELSPPRETQSPFTTNPALAEAVRKGWITLAEDLSGTPPPRHPVAPTSELLEELDADRADR
ncbi:MAG: type II toxin-antitoxin system Phd/YefM family antitoxin, partial [bacterium]